MRWEGRSASPEVAPVSHEWNIRPGRVTPA